MVYDIFYMEALHQVTLRVHRPDEPSRDDEDFPRVRLSQALDQASVAIKMYILDAKDTKKVEDVTRVRVLVHDPVRRRQAFDVPFIVRGQVALVEEEVFA
jgi:hypothetical protein